MKFRTNANAVVTNAKREFLLVRLKRVPFKEGLCIPDGCIEPGDLMQAKSQNRRVVFLAHTTAEGTPQETGEASADWYTFEDAESHLIPFAKKAIELWRNGGCMFSHIE